MSNFPNMDGLDLFTVPFDIPQPVKPKIPETYSQPAPARN